MASAARRSSKIGGGGGVCLKKPLPSNCPPRHLHVVPLWKLSARCTTESSPV